MGSGCHLPGSIRRLIYFNRCKLGKSAAEIHDLLFHENPESVTVNHIEHLCTLFYQNEDKEAISMYLNVQNSRKANAGRPKLLGAEECDFLRSLLLQKCNRYVKDMTEELYAVIDLEFDAIPSSSTVLKTLHAMGMTHKVLLVQFILVTVRND
jgi:hypothetical protein